MNACSIPGCLLVFDTHHALSVHVQNEHHRFLCTIDGCTKTFASRSGVRDHIPPFHHQRNYPCDICGTTFMYRASLRTHRQKSHPEQAKVVDMNTNTIVDTAIMPIVTSITVGSDSVIATPVDTSVAVKVMVDASTQTSSESLFIFLTILF